MKIAKTFLVIIVMALLEIIAIRPATVYSINPMENTVIFETCDGNLWERGIEGNAQYKIGTSVLLEFSTMNNQNIYDDAIITVINLE